MAPTLRLSENDSDDPMAGNSAGPLFVWQQHTASNCFSDNGVYVLGLREAKQNGQTNNRGIGRKQLAKWHKFTQKEINSFHRRVNPTNTRSPAEIMLRKEKTPATHNSSRVDNQPHVWR